MRVHITRTEQYHEDITPEQLAELEQHLIVATNRDHYAAMLAEEVADHVDRFLAEDLFPEVTVNVSEAEFREYRERIGRPVPIPGQVDIFGGEAS